MITDTFRADLRAGAVVFLCSPAAGFVTGVVVPEDCAEMITFFNISGAMIYLDAEGRTIGYEDVRTKIEMCRRHYAAVGLGADHVAQFVR